MGFVKLIDGNYIHGSQLPVLNEYPLKWIHMDDFEKELKSKQVDVDSEIIDIVNKNFWDLV